jgi:hypothetical protein
MSVLDHSISLGSKSFYTSRGLNSSFVVTDYGSVTFSVQNCYGFENYIYDSHFN